MYLRVRFDIMMSPLPHSSLRKMAVGMILASLAFAVAALVEIKVNVSSVNVKLPVCSIHSSYMFSLDPLGLNTVSISQDGRGECLSDQRNNAKGDPVLT